MKRILPLLAAAVLMAGCTSTRSISYHSGNRNYSYGGELSQMDVISALSTDGAVAAAQPPVIPKSGRVILIQSGQQTPDAQVINGLSSQIGILPFSGIPGKNGINGVSWRQAAKAGDVKTVVVYWGEVETSYENSATKAISWIPVIGWTIPDEHQQMRVSLKYLVADVATGTWAFASIASRESQVSTSLFSRDSDDWKQIAELKQDAFAKFTEAISALVK